jgi:hypothetical protein
VKKRRVLKWDDGIRQRDGQRRPGDERDGTGCIAHWIAIGRRRQLVSIPLRLQKRIAQTQRTQMNFR